LTNGPDNAVSETGRAALRGLFDRLRNHVLEAERSTEEALSAAASDPVAAAQLLEAPRGAAADVARMAADLAALTPGQADLDVLRRVADELRTRALRLDARLAEADAAIARAAAGLTDRLDRWDAASAEQDRHLAITVAARLDAAERRRHADVTRLRQPARPRSRDAAPAPQAPPVRRGSRSAALLLSAGVACLGLTTLAVVLEPPFPLDPPDAPGAHADIVLRGPILVAPPRFATAEELPDLKAGSTAGAGAEKQLAAAITAAERGGPGALAELRRLADAGMLRAQMYLAKLYEAGRGVAADSAEARRWTARAADSGDPIAMHNLALYYLEGRGGPRDDGTAARLFRRSAAAGVADSQFNLGLLYETGAGVERNLPEAYRWFQTAANTGDLKARERAVALEARLSSIEVAGAERLAASFRPGAHEVEEAVLAPGASTIAESQKKLARLGFYIGPTDGRDTPAYRQAVEAYRKSQRTQSASMPGTGDF
jgi:localization factor PodJL